MKATFSPLQVLLLTLAGWVNRHQQHVIDYLIEENRILKEGAPPSAGPDLITPGPLPLGGTHVRGRERLGGLAILPRGMSLG